MKRESTKNIAQYFGSIPDMLKLLQQERNSIGQSCNQLDASEKADAQRRLQEITCRILELERDAQTIRNAIDTLERGYNQVIFLRYVGGYTWGQISVRLRQPDGTIRHWHDNGLDRLSEVLETAPQADLLMQRAYRARL